MVVANFIQRGLLSVYGKLLARAARCESPPPTVIKLPDNEKYLGAIARDHIQKEERFRALVENAWEVVACLGPDSEILYTTSSVKRALGYTPQEVTGRLGFDFIAPADRNKIIDIYNDLVMNRNSRVERFRLLHKSGEERWVQCTGINLLANPAVRAVVIYYHDISENVKIEDLERSNREKLSLALKASKMGVFEWDLATDQIECSEQAAVLHGFPREEITATLEDIMGHAAPGEAERVIPFKREAVKAGKEYSIEYKIIFPDASEHWVMTRGQPEFKDNKPVKVFGVAADITHEQQREERLRAASEAKSQFLANMSHEIRTPLGAILGFTDLIRDPKATNEERIHYAEIVYQNGHQLATVVDDILDISKIEAGKLDVQMCVFSLASLVAETSSFLRPLATEKQVLLNVAPIPDEVPERVCSDPARVKQVLTNIIGNAVKFTMPGGQIMVKLGVRETGSSKCAVIDIQDTGIGMSQDQQQKIFEIFFQADSSRTRKFQGTGLGLSLSKHLANLLGGDLRLLHSEPGKGSTFRFSFDMYLSESPMLEKMASKRPEPKSISGTRVLLAEDSPDNQLLISHLLSSEGAVVDTADNGREAVEKAFSDDYDVILMDIQMPVLDGYQATELLRKKGYKGKIVALTAHALKEEREYSLTVGCDDHLTKPINRTRLIEAVAR